VQEWGTRPKAPLIPREAFSRGIPGGGGKWPCDVTRLGPYMAGEGERAARGNQYAAYRDLCCCGKDGGCRQLQAPPPGHGSDETPAMVEGPVADPRRRVVIATGRGTELCCGLLVSHLALHVLEVQLGPTARSRASDEGREG